MKQALFAQQDDASREWRVMRLTMENMNERFAQSGANAIECRFMHEAQCAVSEHTKRNVLCFKVFWQKGRMKIVLTNVWGEGYRHIALPDGETKVYDLACIEDAIWGRPLDLTHLETTARAHFFGLVSALQAICAEEEQLLLVRELQELEAMSDTASYHSQVKAA